MTCSGQTSVDVDSQGVDCRWPLELLLGADVMSTRFITVAGQFSILVGIVLQVKKVEFVLLEGPF